LQNINFHISQKVYRLKELYYKYLLKLLRRAAQVKHTLEFPHLTARGNSTMRDVRVLNATHPFGSTQIVPAPPEEHLREEEAERAVEIQQRDLLRLMSHVS
jgi:hypothetical protein